MSTITKIGDYTITSYEDLIAFDISSGAYLLTLDELQSVTLAQTQDTVEVTGKQGRLLNRLKRNKAVTISGTSGLVSGPLMALQTGCDLENKVTEILWDEDIIVSSNSAATTHTAVGETGSEIVGLYVKNSDFTLGTELKQDTTTGDDTFTYDPATKALAFADGAIADGTELKVYYKRKIQADVLENMSDTYSGKAALYLNVTAEDVCNNVYHIQINIPKADFSGEFSLELGDSQVTHAFEASALAGACGTAGMFYSYTVFGENVEDAE